MRQIVLDTETTGLEPAQGHRIIEVGCVEVLNRRLTGNNLHLYTHPDREIDAGAAEVHGITLEQLEGKPRFHEIADDLRAYLGDADLVIHNAPFDLGFLNAEFERVDADMGLLESRHGIIDTLVDARQRYPGQRNSLDALCKRLGVDNTHRDLHGGLLDAQLLADVYLAMTSGQSALDLGFDAGAGDEAGAGRVRPVELTRRPRVLRANEAELAAHERRLQALDQAAGGESVWRRLDAATEPVQPA